MDIQKLIALLELEPPLTPLAVHRAYRRMVKRWHPDQFAHQPEIHAQAQERLKAINEAYTIVKRCAEAQTYSAAGPAGVQDAVKPTPTPQGKPMAQSARSQPQHHKSRTRPAGTAQTRCAPSHLDSSGARPSLASSFERILREAGYANIPASNHPKTGSRRLSGFHPGRRLKNNMRVKGTGAISPIQPVRPISRIRPIGESE